MLEPYELIWEIINAYDETYLNNIDMTFACDKGEYGALVKEGRVNSWVVEENDNILTIANTDTHTERKCTVERKDDVVVLSRATQKEQW